MSIVDWEHDGPGSASKCANAGPRTIPETIGPMACDAPEGRTWVLGTVESLRVLVAGGHMRAAAELASFIADHLRDGDDVRRA
jgi:hypothetical protein